jgi:predicted nucleotidyltransferase
MKKAVSKPAVDRETLRLIKRVILEEARKLGVEVKRIILFGSRARGEARPDSDYDILIVIGHANREVKRKLWGNIHKRLVRSLKAPIDVIILTLPYWKKYENVPGTILYPAKKEGITIA